MGDNFLRSPKKINYNQAWTKRTLTEWRDRALNSLSVENTSCWGRGEGWYSVWQRGQEQPPRTSKSCEDRRLGERSCLSRSRWSSPTWAHCPPDNPPSSCSELGSAGAGLRLFLSCSTTRINLHRNQGTAIDQLHQNMNHVGTWGFEPFWIFNVHRPHRAL